MKPGVWTQYCCATCLAAIVICFPLRFAFSQSDEFDVNSLPNKNQFKAHHGYSLKASAKTQRKSPTLVLYQNGKVVFTCRNPDPHPLDVLEYAQYLLLRDSSDEQLIVQISSPRHSTLCILDLSPRFRVLYEGGFPRDEILFEDTDHDGNYEFRTDANDGILYYYDKLKRLYQPRSSTIEK